MTEWFYPALEAYVHYIPLRHDLSDLLEKLEWCKQNDQQVESIAKRSTQFIKQNLMPQHVLEQLSFFLLEYSKKQKLALFKPEYPPARIPDFNLW